jgi:hypothetical protein
MQHNKEIRAEVLIDLIEKFIETYKEESNEQWFIEFCDKLNALSIKH